jgi:lactate dehydrogenase-like 2-hydroxyacid dehydrogenase
MDPSNPTDTRPRLDTDKTTSKQPCVLLRLPFLHPWRDVLEHDFRLLTPVNAAEEQALIGSEGANIRAIVTNATYGAPEALLTQLPALEMIAVFSAGYEGLDVAGARARGLALSHGPGANAAAVADLAFGLMLGLLRQLPQRDRLIRTGAWQEIRGITRTLSGKRLGLLGLGQVGQAIARRAQGFDMTVSYCKPSGAASAASAASQHGWQYQADLTHLAAQSDVLVVACPGGAATQHLVNARVLQALGRQGWLINISRGSVVDTEALIAALQNGTIAGAGLDVYEHEPQVPLALRSQDNVLLQPHVAGFTEEAFAAGMDLVRRNLLAHFSGQPLITPIPA